MNISWEVHTFRFSKITIQIDTKRALLSIYADFTNLGDRTEQCWGICDSRVCATMPHWKCRSDGYPSWLSPGTALAACKAAFFHGSSPDSFAVLASIVHHRREEHDALQTAGAARSDTVLGWPQAASAASGCPGIITVVNMRKTCSE